MHIDVVTIFPQLFPPFLATSLVGKAIEAERMAVEVHDLRDFTDDRHQVVDDEPFGGGGGMVMKAEPWLAAARQLAADSHRVLLSPQGTRLDEEAVRRLADQPKLFLMCGRYEAIDERVLDTVVDEEISIGDYVLSGGEVAAMVVIEAVSRQIPGVVGLADSVEADSFRNGLLDHPHYTRPQEVEGMGVPDVLLSGNHAEIDSWRRRRSLLATARKRPDLLAQAELTDEEREWLNNEGFEAPIRHR